MDTLSYIQEVGLRNWYVVDLLHEATFLSNFILLLFVSFIGSLFLIGKDISLSSGVSKKSIKSKS